MEHFMETLSDLTEGVRPSPTRVVDKPRRRGAEGGKRRSMGRFTRRVRQDQA
jgi:hypothetical protein